MLINPKTQNFRDLTSFQRELRDAFIKDVRIEYFPVYSCRLCGSSSQLKIAEYDQYEIPLQTVLCGECGLIYSKDQMTNSGAKIFYEYYYRKIYENVPCASLTHGFYRKLYHGWVPKVPAFVNSRASVLEIGCGGGWNLIPYLKKGIAHLGFDYDSDMVRFGKTRYGLNLEVGGLDEAIERNVKADYVIVSQVLEHLADPVDFLSSLKRCISETGLLCVTVPCLDYLRFFGGNSTHFTIDLNLQNAHNFMFSEYTLDFALRRAGYTPLLVLGGYALARIETSVTRRPIEKPSSPFKDIVEIYRMQGIKLRLSKIIPRFFWLLLTRAFYISRPIRTMKFILLNRLGTLALRFIR